MTALSHSKIKLNFSKDILKEAENIENGLGWPNWQLVICLIVAWCIIGLVLIKGIQSSGKVWINKYKFQSI